MENKHVCNNDSNIFSRIETRVLVVAPQFPSINQPWMDTYLEQLIRHGLKPLIYTCNRTPGKYSKKVDLLHLRDYVVDFDLAKMISLQAVIQHLCSDPLSFLDYLCKALFLSFALMKKYSLSLIPTFVKVFSYYFLAAKLKNVDIIHAHDDVLAFEFMLYSLIQRIPLIYTFHGLTPNGVPSLADNKRKALYGKLKKVIVNTNFAKQQVQELGCPVEKIIVLPQGLPLEDFPYVPRSAPAKDAQVVLLTVGRYHYEKGQRYALLALRRLRDWGIDAKWHFVGVGPDLRELKYCAKALQVDKFVSFHSELTLQEIKPLYHSSHLFVLPSLSARKKGAWAETQGVVLLEAQATGCIPIATKTGGIPECLHDKKDSILIRDRSSRAIAEAIIYLLERPEEWPRYQKNGRRNVEQNFSAKVIGKKMAELLSKCVADKAA